MKSIVLNIEKLSDYFDNFELRQKSTVHNIEDFKKYYPLLSPQLIDFYNYCDGFDAHLKDYVVGDILSLESHLKLIESMRSGENPLFTYLFPVRTDGCACFDCVMFTEKTGNNSLIYWDIDSGLPSYLNASSFDSFITFLTTDLITRYRPDGTIKKEYDLDNPDPLPNDWPFNAKAMIQKDLGLKELYLNKEYAKHFEDPDALPTYLE